MDSWFLLISGFLLQVVSGFVQVILHSYFSLCSCRFVFKRLFNRDFGFLHYSDACDNFVLGKGSSKGSTKSASTRLFSKKRKSWMAPWNRLVGVGHCPWNECSKPKHLAGLWLDYPPVLGKGTSGQLQEYTLR